MPPEKVAFPSAPQAAFLLLAGFLLQYLVAAALHDLRHGLGLGSDQLATLGMLLANGVLVGLVAHKLGIRHRDLMHPGKTPAIATFVLLVPPVLCLLPLILLLDVVLVDALEAIFPTSSWEQAAFADMAAPTVSAFIAACVLAPLLEELLFRGILLRAFLAQYPRGLAIGYSALYFGVAHLNIYQFCLAFLLGLFLGWLYERSRSLIPCIALHAALNTSVTVLGHADPASTSLSPASPLTWLLATVGATAGALVLRYLLVRPRLERPDAP